MVRVSPEGGAHEATRKPRGRVRPRGGPLRPVGLLALILLLACAIEGSSAPAAAPRFGGTLVYGRNSDAVSLDPANQWDGASAQVINNIYDNLVVYGTGTIEIEGSLAETWEVSADQLSWTFRLRPGMEFHDGTPLDAAAVAFNFERQRDVNHPFRLGKAECYESHFRILESLDVVDTLSVRFRLSAPYAPFVELLAMGPVAIASPTAIRKFGKDFYKNPVGSGPFRFTEWIPGDKIVLSANQTYWGERPYLDSLVFRTIPDSRIRLVQLSSGTLHLMSGPNPDDLEAVARNPALQILSLPGMNIGYLAMNCEKPPLSDRRVRTAINLAINKPAVVNFLNQGTGVVAKNPLPPTLWGYNDTVEDFVFDVAKARKMIKDAGLPKDYRPRLFYLPISRDSIPQPEKLAHAIERCLKEIGIEPVLETCDWKTYQERVMAGEHDLAMLTWSADIGDPDNFLYVLFGSDNAIKGRAENIAFFRNPELDGLLLAARQTTNRKARERAYWRAQEIIHSEAPWVNLAHGNQIVIRRNTVRNLILSPMTYDSFSRVWLDETR